MKRAFPYEVGTYLYTVQPQLLGKGYEIERVVVLRNDGNGYAIGSSKKMSSLTMSCPHTSGGLPFHRTTPEAALRAYKARMGKLHLQEIAALEEQIDRVRATIVRIAALDVAKLKVRSYPDDWEPVDL